MKLEKEFADKKKILIAQRLKKLDNIFDRTYSEIANSILETEIKNPSNFSWSNNRKLERKIMQVIGRLRTNVQKSVLESVVLSWNLANLKNDNLVAQYLANVQMENIAIRKLFMETNLSALNEFINRTDAGMDLSQRVWNLGQGLKDELETYLGTGIAEGRSSQQLTSDVKRFLQEPDKRFRRVRGKDGKLQLSKPAKEYHPGAGIYRSASKNARRLVVTETNIAYNMSDYVRRQQLDFVVGVRVKLSPSHDVPDICDDFKGEYPKNFIFKGWHPHCFCYTESILLSKEEFLDYLSNGKVPKGIKIDRIPDGIKNWVKENKPKLELMKSKPYFYVDNFVS